MKKKIATLATLAMIASCAATPVKYSNDSIVETLNSVLSDYPKKQEQIKEVDNRKKIWQCFDHKRMDELYSGDKDQNIYFNQMIQDKIENNKESPDDIANCLDEKVIQKKDLDYKNMETYRGITFTLDTMTSKEKAYVVFQSKDGKRITLKNIKLKEYATEKDLDTITINDSEAIKKSSNVLLKKTPNEKGGFDYTLSP